MVKILSYIIKDYKIRVKTDNPGRPEFVYEKHKFITKAALLAEIEKSINIENKIKDIKEANLTNLKTELDAIKP